MARGVKRKAATSSTGAASNRGSAALFDETDRSDGEGRHSASMPVHPTPGKGKPQTVIEFLEAQRDQAVQTILARGEKLVAGFREEAAQAKKTILASLSEGSADIPRPPTDEILVPHEAPLHADVKGETKVKPGVVAPTAAKARRSYGDEKTIHITCTGGVYSGQRFTLVLATDAHRICHIGRSSGKKYKAPHGLSLPKDPEISTTHAELRWSADDDHIYLTDQNSTNGTKLNGRTLKSRVPVRLDLSRPLVVCFGGCDFTFSM